VLKADFEIHTVDVRSRLHLHSLINCDITVRGFREFWGLGLHSRCSRNSDRSISTGRFLQQRR